MLSMKTDFSLIGLSCSFLILFSSEKRLSVDPITFSSLPGALEETMQHETHVKCLHMGWLFAEEDSWGGTMLFEVRLHFLFKPNFFKTNLTLTKTNMIRWGKEWCSLITCHVAFPGG